MCVVTSICNNLYKTKNNLSNAKNLTNLNVKLNNMIKYYEIFAVPQKLNIFSMKDLYLMENF